jgi:hypothetical protein
MIVSRLPNSHLLYGDATPQPLRRLAYSEETAADQAFCCRRGLLATEDVDVVTATPPNQTACLTGR